MQVIEIAPVLLGGFVVFCIFIFNFWHLLHIWACRQTFGAFPPIRRTKRKHYLEEKIVPAMEALAKKVLAAREVHFQQVNRNNIGITDDYIDAAEAEYYAIVTFREAEELVEYLGLELPSMFLDYPNE